MLQIEERKHKFGYLSKVSLISWANYVMQMWQLHFVSLENAPLLNLCIFLQIVH